MLLGPQDWASVWGGLHDRSRRLPALLPHREGAGLPDLTPLFPPLSCLHSHGANPIGSQPAWEPPDARPRASP